MNQDGSINGPDRPAKPGDVILLFATGEGQTDPAGIDGKTAVSPLPAPQLPVTVSIGGKSSRVLYAGGAPGEVAGLMQLNVQVPAGLVPGSAIPVAVRVGDSASQPNVTISVSN